MMRLVSNISPPRYYAALAACWPVSPTATAVPPIQEAQVSGLVSRIGLGAGATGVFTGALEAILLPTGVLEMASLLARPLDVSAVIKAKIAAHNATLAAVLRADIFRSLLASISS